ncbi:hypothetical protein K501DRAFT_270515 [Backusella circina FSU 941]|nr:hypothetical protein K501DRAFT_270515 [Backusella circina FSU 941]
MMLENVLVTRELSLAILLHRLSFPRRNIIMQYTFGIRKDNISRIVNGMSKILYEKFKTGIASDERQFSKENLEKISNAIVEKGACLSHIIRFIDGTMQQILCPKDTDIQKLEYNGWKHILCVKFQAISTPDGSTSSVCEPYNGSNND